MRKYLFLFAVILTFLSVPAWAQREPTVEVGVKGGIGNYGYIDDLTRDRGVVGAEVCAFCTSRYSFFGNYDHWFKPSGTTGYRSADSVAAGLRIQAARTVSPFFDMGVAVGNSRYRTWNLTTVGAAFGGGLRIPLGARAYTRPQLRLNVMSHGYLAGSAEVSVGWRL